MSAVVFNIQALNLLPLLSMLNLVLGIVRHSLEMSSFSNPFACLSHHKTSLRGAVQDYVLNFNSLQFQIEDIVTETLDLIEQLISSLNGRRVLGRLVAKVNYTHINSMTNEENDRSYHFPSYSSEEIEDVEDFYTRHMTKIISRMDSFNKNGSNLMIKNVEHIHIQLSVKS